MDREDKWAVGGLSIAVIVLIFVFALVVTGGRSRTPIITPSISCSGYNAVTVKNWAYDNGMWTYVTADNKVVSTNAVCTVTDVRK